MQNKLLEPTSIKKGETLSIIVPVTFRPLQKEYLQDKQRFNILLAHRRFGKSVVLILDLILSMISCKKKNPMFWYVAPTLEQATAIAWKYIKDFCSSLPNVQISETNKTVVVNFNDGFGDRTIRLVGVDDSGESKRGSYLDGVVIDEMGHIKRGAWESIIRPALSDRKGWATLTGTPTLGYWQELFEEAQNIEEWKVFDYGDARVTGVISEAELLSAEHTSNDRAKFRREFYGEWISPDIGCYYSENLFALEDLGHISPNISYNANLPIITSWDLGVNDYTVVWFSQYDPHNDILTFFDYFQVRGVTDSLQVLAEVEKKGHKIDLIVLPHDSTHKYTNSRGSTYDLFKERYPVVLLKKSPSKVQDIQIVKNFLHACRINSEKCSKGILELHKYRSTLNSKTDILSTTPMHNDAADSFRYNILGLFQSRSRYSDFRGQRVAIRSSTYNVPELI